MRGVYCQIIFYVFNRKFINRKVGEVVYELHASVVDVATYTESVLCIVVLISEDDEVACSFMVDLICGLSYYEAIVFVTDNKTKFQEYLNIVGNTGAVTFICKDGVWD